MSDKVDIRAHIAADTQLQAEINRALLAIADSLSQAGDPRIVRILNRTLEASWAEHVSFQDEVVFPIVIGRHSHRVTLVIDGLRSEHAGLSQRHAEIGNGLNDLQQDKLHDVAGFDTLLRATHELRRRHLIDDAELIGLLPASFSAAETDLCRGWAARRPVPRFPLNVLRSSRGRSFRFGRHLH